MQGSHCEPCVVTAKRSLFSFSPALLEPGSIHDGTVMIMDDLEKPIFGVYAQTKAVGTETVGEYF